MVDEGKAVKAIQTLGKLFTPIPTAFCWRNWLLIAWTSWVKDRLDG